jgi:mevalonate kinase
MKKADSKKLRLSRETLQTLSRSEAKMAAGGSKFSCPSGCGECGITTMEGPPTESC